MFKIIKKIAISKFALIFLYPRFFMSNRISLFLVLICMLVLQSFAATAGTATVRYREGDVQRTKAGETNWKMLTVGQKVSPKDTVKSALESRATLGLKDGTMITITENSFIALSEMLEEDGSYRTTVDVITGQLVFAVQKQERNSEFKFKTGVMAAAIRGTEGCISGNVHGLVGLKNGALQIDLFSGEKALIRGGQVAFRLDSLIVLDLRSAGDPDFHKLLSVLIEDTAIVRDDLIRRIREEDSAYQELLTAARKDAKCFFEALPDTVHSQEIRIHGRCAAGSKVNFYGEWIQLDDDGKFLQTVTLDSVAVGEKRFKLTCSNGRLNFDCAEAMTYYKPAEALFQNTYVLTSPVPATVCEDGLVVEGTYQVKDSLATLFLNVGDVYKSSNLIKIADGESHPFAQNVTLSDRNGLWNVKTASLEFEVGGVKDVREIPLKIDHTCRGVNQTPPALQFIGYDSLACKANIAIGSSQDDMGIFKVDIDNMGGKSTIVEKNMTTKVSLKPGIHDYEFIAEDQAGNVASISRTLGCFPNKFFSIKIDGGNGNEVVWGGLQAYPGGKKAPIQRTLRFSIDLPNENEVYSVMVRQNGRVVLKDVLAQIASLDYEVPVELMPRKNKLEIIVKHKSGYVATATKIYEVK